jgi:hypothetical protein
LPLVIYSCLTAALTASIIFGSFSCSSISLCTVLACLAGSACNSSIQSNSCYVENVDFLIHVQISSTVPSRMNKPNSIIGSESFSNNSYVNDIDCSVSIQIFCWQILLPQMVEVQARKGRVIVVSLNPSTFPMVSRCLKDNNARTVVKVDFSPTSLARLLLQSLFSQRSIAEI